jgi:hypothetical protein
MNGNFCPKADISELGDPIKNTLRGEAGCERRNHMKKTIFTSTVITIATINQVAYCPEVQHQFAYGLLGLIGLSRCKKTAGSQIGKY